MISTAKRLAYTLAFIELHLLDEARAEFAQISVSDRTSPAVYPVEMELAMAGAAWLRVTELAACLVELAPASERPWIAWAYALRELQRVDEAREKLLRGEAAIAAPSILVDYNLACYFCLLGDLAEARRRLARVYKRDPAWKKDASTDPDLAALHKRR